MRAKRVGCYIGKYDDDRLGMVIASSRVEVSHVIHQSIYRVRKTWNREPWPPIHAPKPLALYTRKRGEGEWHEGICEI